MNLGSLFSKNRNFKYLLCGIDIFTKYALRDIKYKTVLNAFIEIVNEYNHKRNKLWANQGRKLYNNLMQEWLDNNNVLIFSTHHEAKSVFNGSFIKN